jgi:hypothetical protein
MYQSAVLQKKPMTRLFAHPKNERQRRSNNFWHCVLKHPIGCAVTVSQDRTIGWLPLKQWW